MSDELFYLFGETEPGELPPLPNGRDTAPLGDRAVTLLGFGVDHGRGRALRERGPVALHRRGASSPTGGFVSSVTVKRFYGDNAHSAGSALSKAAKRGYLERLPGSRPVKFRLRDKGRELLARTL